MEPKIARVRRLALAAFSAVLLCMLLLVGANAEVDVTAESTTSFITPSSGAVIDAFDASGKGNWQTVLNVDSLASVRNGNGIGTTETFMRAFLSREAKGDEYSVIRIFPEELNLLQYSHLSLVVRIPLSEPAYFRVRLRLYSGLDSLTAEETLPCAEWVTITMDVSDWTKRASVNAVEITLIDEMHDASQMELAALVAEGAVDLSLANRFLTFGYTAEGGSALLDGETFLLDAGSDGDLTLVTDAARSEYGTASGTAVMRIVMDNTQTGGTLSLAVSDGNLSVASFKIASSCTLYAGRNTYLLPYDPAIPIYAYRLSFRGLFPDDPDSAVRLLEVSLETFASAQRESLGKITECTWSPATGKVTVAGTLSVSAVTAFYGGKLELYEIPVGKTDFAPEKAAASVSIKISTRFSFSVDTAGRQSPPQTTRYAVYIHHNDRYYPLASEAAAVPESAGGASRSSLSVVGISGGEPGGVFISNASSVICDVDLSALLTDSKTGKLVVAGGNHYYLNNTLLHALDEELDFYLAADLEIFLRLRTDGALPAGDEVNRLYAVTNLLAERYKGIRGIILGDSMNTGSAADDTGAYAAAYADLLRVVYSSAAVYVPDIFVLVPIDCDDTAGDTVLFGAALSEAIQADGGLPWGVLASSDDPAAALAHTQNLLAQLKAIGASVPHDFMLLWHVPKTAPASLVLDEYADFCVSAESAGARAVFLSLEGRSDHDTICEGLKRVLNGTGRMLYEYEASVISADSAWAGNYVLADFSGSYSTLGWRAGSGCARLGTQAKDMRSGERSLHATFPPENGGAFDPVSGNILWVTGITDDFSIAPYFCVSLQVLTELESSDRADITFIFGSGDVRAEYSVTVPTGKRLTVLCDLSAFANANTVDFTAIALRADSPASLDLYSITAGSNEYDDATLTRLFRYRTAGQTAAAGKKQDLAPVLIAGASVVVLSTAIVIALLSRRREDVPESDEKEERT